MRIGNSHKLNINKLKYRTSKKSGNRVNVGNHFVIKDTNGNVIYNPA